jgi:RNA polymerase sigma-70 factor (ECF subfamily)
MATDVDHARDELLDRLVVNASKRAYRIAHDLLRNPAEAEDAVQDALAKACESHRSLRDSDLAEAWFLRIVTTSCLRILRRRRLKHSLLGRIDSPLLPSAPSSEQVLTDSRAAARVVELVQTLPPMQRAALILRYGHDLSVGDIAELTSTKPATIKTHLVRGLSRLRGKLRTDGEDQ